MTDNKKVFISYAREDLPTGRRLYDELRRYGLDPWLDVEKLLPGQKWKNEIKQAIRESAYFIAVLSQKAVSKRGFVQRELKQALEVLDDFPESDVFVIPVRVNECSPSHERLNELHRVDLFPSFEAGFKKVAAVIIPTASGIGPSKIESPEIRFYVYVSDSKLRMLCSQLPDALVADLTAELNVAQTMLNTSSTEPLPPASRYAMVRLVEEYLTKHSNIGTVDSPDAYFLGELPMKWGEYETLTKDWDGPSPLVYFGGESEKTIVGLGGSTHHVIGAVGPTSAHSHSATPYMVARLYEGLELPLPTTDKDMLKVAQEHFGTNDSRNIAMAVDLATSQMVGTAETLSFLARRLAFFPKNKHEAWRGNMNILLGTPIYVSLADG